VDAGTLWGTIGGGLVSAATSGVLAYRQGRRTSDDAHDRDVEQRLRDVEFEVTDIRATMRERKHR
jgi:hypothetical protein